MAVWTQKKGRQEMPKKRFTAEQIISKLREAEVELAKGRTVAQVVKRFRVSNTLMLRMR